MINIEVAGLSGCRSMEMLELEWSRVDFCGRQFTVIANLAHCRNRPA